MFNLEKNQVLVVHCDSYERSAVEKAYVEIFKHINVDKLENKNVFIKPNILNGSKPETATTTHPEVVFSIANFCVKNNARVTCGDSPNFITIKPMINSIYRTTGIAQVIEEANGAMDNSSSGVMVEGGKYLPKFKMLKNIKTADIVINVAKAKTHSFTGYTGTVKNLFGVIPGAVKGELHLNNPSAYTFSNALIDICETVNADLHIVDGVIAMEGPGPSSGTPKQLGVIVAGSNPYAVDEVIVELMGLDKDTIPQIKAARERGLTKPIENIEIIGADIDKIKEKSGIFKGAQPDHDPMQALLKILLPENIYIKTKKKPIISNNCIKCGVCVEACPPNAIHIDEKKAIIDYSKCIRCYCCQELCPSKVITIGKKR